MGDLYERVSETRTGLEKLLGKIPGYKGYKEKEMRRESDKLLRETVATQMEIQRRRMDDLQKQLIAAGRFEYLDEMGNATTKLQTFIDRVRKAAYGYAGLFDAVRVREEELDRLYDFDNQLLGFVEQLSAALSNLETSIPGGEGLAEAVRRVMDICAEANRTFDGREQVILGAV
ncbi:MAG TPA: hypothetical protein EYH30_04335 [Anaerolineales bacterium]|nr:hypothetical protein [Anaerolineae bacterium]HIQ01344.1 hypothetical protein [Anaerolineales bacterium]